MRIFASKFYTYIYFRLFDCMSRSVNRRAKYIEKTRRFFSIKNVVIILLVITNLFTLLSWQNIKNDPFGQFQNPYPLLDLSRNFIEQENFIVNLQPLRETLREINKEYGEENSALYVEFLNTGANIAINQDARYYPASLIKMPVAIATVKQIQDGKWKWDSKLVIFEEDVDTKFGDLGKLPIGTRLTIKELLTELLTKSDNTAYKMLLRNLGVGAVGDFLTDTGLNEFFDRDLNITVKEYTRLFRTLYTSSYLRREYSEQILRLLSESERNYLGQAIPAEVGYSHKFGENVEEKIFADAGIVYLTDRPYVMTILYKGGDLDDKTRVDSFFYKVSEAIYKYFSENDNENL